MLLGTLDDIDESLKREFVKRWIVNADLRNLEYIARIEGIHINRSVRVAG